MTRRTSPRVFANTAVSVGTNALSLSIPAGATLGSAFARFRLTNFNEATSDPGGERGNGEVEDYKITIGAAPATGSISGTKFNDLDGDGIKDAGEPGRGGVTINLDLGANGSVKSTLVKAILGLVPLASGEIRLFGTPQARFSDWFRIGYVPQRLGAGSGVPATVGEVVASGRLARRGFLRPARFGQSQAQAAMRRGHIWFQANCLFQMVDGLRQLARHDQCITQIAVGFGKIGLQLHRHVVLLDGLRLFSQRE